MSYSPQPWTSSACLTTRLCRSRLHGPPEPLQLPQLLQLHRSYDRHILLNALVYLLILFVHSRPLHRCTTGTSLPRHADREVPPMVSYNVTSTTTPITPTCSPSTDSISYTTSTLTPRYQPSCTSGFSCTSNSHNSYLTHPRLPTNLAYNYDLPVPSSYVNATRNSRSPQHLLIQWQLLTTQNVLTICTPTRPR